MGFKAMLGGFRPKPRLSFTPSSSGMASPKPRPSLPGASSGGMSGLGNGMGYGAGLKTRR